MIDREAVLVRTNELVTAPMGRELAMMNIESGSYFILDEIAAFIWERLAEPTSAAALCASLTERYDVSGAQCEADILPFLHNLNGRGLVRIVE